MKALFLLLFFLFRPFLSFGPFYLLEEIEEIETPFPSLLNQSFHFLGEGAQLKAFASEDGKYVLKLFKASHVKRKSPFKQLKRRLRSAQAKALSKQKWDLKFQQTCARYSFALNYLSEESGLIFLHFQKSKTPFFVTVNTLLGEKRLDLSAVPFIVQKRAELVPHYLKRCQKDPKKLEEAKQSLKAFFVRRCQKAVTDPRQCLSINFGFCEDSPMQIDVGKLTPLESSMEKEIEKIHSNIDLWMQAHGF